MSVYFFLKAVKKISKTALNQLTNFFIYYIINKHCGCAAMSSGCGGMADAPDLGSGVLDVGVQVPSSAP